MISKYKTKIILGYTGLLFFIIVAILGMAYSILSFQLRQEIDHNLKDKIKRMDTWIVDTVVSPSCDREFYRTIMLNRRIGLNDLLNITDRADDKYLLFIRCSDEIMYISRKYEALGEELYELDLKSRKIETLDLAGTHFSLSTINNTGYSVSLGYELSTIKALQKKIIRLFFTSFPFVVLASVLFVYFVTQRLMRIVDTITETTARITSKNLNERIPIPAGKDEITNLIVTINAMIDRLEKSFIMIQQFSQDAAHELRTPMTIIRGEIENMMLQKKLTKNNAKSLESVLEEIHYLSSIVNKLLLLHSLDTDEEKFSFKALNLSDIIDDLLEDVLILALKKDIEVHADGERDIMINGNEELISQMIWNILDNAVKYTNAKGNIRITVAKSGSVASIKFIDTGIGIPPDSLPKIFTRFYRVEQSHSREIVGSGLGLAISKWIAVLHKGDIKVSSQVNEGSVFTVYLPIKD